MITKITNNKKTYFKQFEAINKALERAQSPIRINSLEDYFSNIRTIASLTKIGSNVKGKFLIMPLDELFFEIDANARTIKIPDNFKKNGIGVQNDHWAEILYFKVDRYYDYQDLSSLNIFINWEFVASGQKNSEEQEIKVSKAFAPDPDFDKNALIFGWVVDRSMCPRKGQLKFSVTFTDSTHPGLAQGYQLSTLISQVNVNEGLVPSLDAELITVSDKDFFARITNSAIAEEGMDTILKAVNWKTLPDIEKDGKLLRLVPANGQDIWVYSTGETISSPIIDKCYFPVKINANSDIYEEEETITLAAEAVTPDMVDRLDYLWATSYSTSEGLDDAHFDILSSSEDNAVISFAFVQTKDTAFDANTIYYKKVGSSLESLSQEDAEAIFNDDEDDTQLYERVCLRTINRGGYYTVRAQSSLVKPVHFITEDTSVDVNKTYYIRDEFFDPEQGEEEYTAVENPTGNPKANGWYESQLRTCNSPIIYSDKFIHVPNAEVPQVVISTANVYTPEIGDYEIVNAETPYNFIDIDRTAANKPEIDIDLVLGEENDGIGGIAWQIGDQEEVSKINNVSVDLIMQNSTDRSNSEFAAVGNYKHVTAIDNIDYDLYPRERVGEEEYHIRIFNQRNHTFTVTDDITAMRLSYVAPKISSYDVIVARGPRINTKMLDAGEKPADITDSMYNFSLNEDNPDVVFKVVENFGEENNSPVNSLLSHYNLADLSYKYFLEEVDYDPDREGDLEKRVNNRKAIGLSTDSKGANEIEILNLNEVVVPEHDTGYYRIRIETYYHDTKSVAYTDMFHVVAG